MAKTEIKQFKDMSVAIPYGMIRKAALDMMYNNKPNKENNMKRVALIPITETKEGKYLYCIQKNNKFSSGTLDNHRPTLETAIKHAVINLGYKHDPKFVLKKLIYTDTENMFYVCIPKEAVDIKGRAQWITETDLKSIDDFKFHIEEIIELINKYKPQLKFEDDENND